MTITSRGPSNIMIVQDLRDPATPYDGAKQMHVRLGQRSRLVSVDQGGHAAYLLKTNVCANDTVTAYLADGVFPVQDVRCAANVTSNAIVPSGQGSVRDVAVQEVMKRMRL